MLLRGASGSVISSMPLASAGKKMGLSEMLGIRQPQQALKFLA
ncbi:hypothetical protein [Variovorax ginsengisoli]|uniref:Uncharacterized protein n=1 Tax=Variovorax ginsengisoli TaxID=363844 RepID=A0ABT8SBZ1_9BURK|nr:hypothetical protein [Variovorax ginsengisoli]MDN8617270.1 hypothetical protein [Variovorax ginsengisoli]MDO1536440.1 hypothetical protein [Variovorax ginsengisoli]